MKAAVLYTTNNPLVIERNINIPELGAGQVLVKISYSGLCGSQLMEVKGFRGEDRYLPHMLGHEATGIIVDIGDEVTKVRVGDKVILSWIKGSGIDAGGVKYLKNGQTINAGPITTFSDYSIVSENRCFRLPKGIPMDIGALLGCAVPTGCGIITNEICPKNETTIAVFGLGGIGLSSLMAINLYNCRKVIAVDIEKKKLEKASELGATHTINASIDDPVEFIYNITNGKGVDYSVDASGNIKSIENAFSVVRKNGGLCVFASHPKTGEKLCLDPHDLISGKQIRGSWGGGCNPDRDFSEFAELYNSGKLPLEKMLDRRYSLDEINTALNDLEQRKITRALIEIDKTIC